MRCCDGWLLLDKPEGISSAKALAKVKSILRVKKAGHTGTLDPEASGLLLIALGQATKFLQLFDFKEKSYSFDMCWGHNTDSDDAAGNPITHTHNIPDVEQIADYIARFPDEYAQTPPAYSALKVNGKRAYALARSGQEVKLQQRRVRVNNLTLHHHQLTPETDNRAISQMSVTLGKGGYVRALGRDIAVGCHSLAHVRHIRRLAIGNLRVTHAISLDSLHKKVDKDNYPGQEWVLDLAALLDGIPAFDASDAQRLKLIHGQSIDADDSDLVPVFAQQDHDTLLLLRYDGAIFGIGRQCANVIKPHRMLF